MQEIESLLYQLWLEKKEGQIYQFILQNNPCWVTQIAKSTNIKRTTVYPYIELLLSKWFIWKTLKWKRILYVPEKPQNLLRDFDKKRETLKKWVNLLNEIYTEKSSTISIENMSWEDDFVKMYRNVQESFNPVYSFFSPAKSNKLIPKWYAVNIWDNWKTIFDIQENNAFYHNKFLDDHAFQKRTYKTFPEWFDVPVDFMAWWWEYTSIISFEKMHGIVIKDKNMHEFFKNLHQFVWNKL